MSHNRSIDHLLSPIAGPFRREADTILDLRDSLAQSPHPGRCVSCYFKLLAAGPDQVDPHLTPLRQWLEQHVEIVARDNTSTGEELETFSLDLTRADSLEDCCQDSIRTVLHDRNFVSTHKISLEFRFRPMAAIA